MCYFVAVVRLLFFSICTDSQNELADCQEAQKQDLHLKNPMLLILIHSRHRHKYAAQWSNTCKRKAMNVSGYKTVNSG